MAAVNNAFEINIDQARIIRDGRVPKRADHSKPGIIDPHVNPTKTPNRSLRQSLDITSFGNVCRNNKRRSSASPHFARDFLQQVRSARGEHDVRALPPELHGRASPDSARRASDDDRLTGQRPRAELSATRGLCVLAQPTTASTRRRRNGFTASPPTKSVISFVSCFAPGRIPSATKITLNYRFRGTWQMMEFSRITRPYSRRTQF